MSPLSNTIGLSSARRGGRQNQLIAGASVRRLGSIGWCAFYRVQQSQLMMMSRRRRMKKMMKMGSNLLNGTTKVVRRNPRYFLVGPAKLFDDNQPPKFGFIDQHDLVSLAWSARSVRWWWGWPGWSPADGRPLLTAGRMLPGAVSRVHENTGGPVSRMLAG